MVDKAWERFHKKLAREYPGKSSRAIDRIEAGIKRKRGWKPKKRKTKKR